MHKIILGEGDLDDLPEELVQALQGLVGKGPHGKRGFGKEKILPEALKERIAEGARLYATSLHHCPYEVGDWVTPRNGFSIKGHGNPYMVVDLLMNPAPAFMAGEPGNASHGRRMDMRVLTMIQDNIVGFWVESYQYEQYDWAKSYKHDDE